MILLRILVFLVTTRLGAGDVFTVRLLRYDTDLPNCDRTIFSQCDPYFKICIFGNCQKTSRLENIDHIDFSQSNVTPNPVYFTVDSHTSTSIAMVHVEVYDHETFTSDRHLASMNYILRRTDVCVNSKILNLSDSHNTRMQIEVSGSCDNAPSTSPPPPTTWWYNSTTPTPRWRKATTRWYKTTTTPTTRWYTPTRPRTTRWNTPPTTTPRTTRWYTTTTRWNTSTTTPPPTTTRWYTTTTRWNRSTTTTPPTTTTPRTTRWYTTTTRWNTSTTRWNTSTTPRTKTKWNTPTTPRWYKTTTTPTTPSWNTSTTRWYTTTTPTTRWYTATPTTTTRWNTPSTSQTAPTSTWYPTKSLTRWFTAKTTRTMLYPSTALSSPPRMWYPQRQTFGISTRTEIVYEQYITVNCQESNWYIRLYVRELQNMFPDFNTRDVYLGSDGCTGYQSGNYIVFDEDYNSCRTNKSTSNDIVVYTNTLVYALHDPNHRFIVREYRFKVKVECDMSKRESGTNNIQHNHGHYEDHTSSGSGHFTIHLKFFSDSNYQNEFSGYPPSYMIGDNVYVKVQTNIHDYDLKMRVSECYTKPSEQSSDAYIYYLIKNGCPEDPNAFITSQSAHETRFYFQDFEYAGHPDSMYVHCNATFCKTDDYSSECEPRCRGRKRIGNINQYKTSTNVDFAEDGMTIMFELGKSPESLNYDQTNTGSASTTYLFGIVFVCVGFVTVLFAVMMALIKRKWKRRKATLRNKEGSEFTTII